MDVFLCRILRFQEFRSHIVGTIKKEEAFGQSFKIRQTGFDGIRVWLQVSNDKTENQGVLDCKLFHKPGDSAPLSVVQIPFTEIEKKFPIKIKFPPQFDIPGQDYYIEFSSSDGEILILGRLEDAYPDGRAFMNRHPLVGDIGFRTSYHYGPVDILG